MRLYVAGPVTGMADLNRPAFERLEAARYSPLLKRNWSDTHLSRCIPILM